MMSDLRDRRFHYRDELRPPPKSVYSRGLDPRDLAMADDPLYTDDLGGMDWISEGFGCRRKRAKEAEFGGRLHTPAHEETLFGNRHLTEWQQLEPVPSFAKKPKGDWDIRDAGKRGRSGAKKRDYWDDDEVTTNWPPDYPEDRERREDSERERWDKYRDVGGRGKRKLSRREEDDFYDDIYANDLDRERRYTRVADRYDELDRHRERGRGSAKYDDWEMRKEGRRGLGEDRYGDQGKDRGWDRGRGVGDKKGWRDDKKLGAKDSARDRSKDGKSKKEDPLSEPKRKLEWWEEEMQPSLSEKLADCYCKYCEVQTSGPKNYENHLEGKRHKMKMAELGLVGPEEATSGDAHAEEQSFAEDTWEEEYWDDDEGLTEEERMKKYFCHLCDVQTTGPDNFKMHNEGMRHKANIERKERGEEPVKGSRNKAGRKKKKLRVNDDGEEVVSVENIIKECKEPLVGLELVTEYFMQEWQTEANFYCTMCESKFPVNNFITHVTGYRHRYGYIKIKRPETKDTCRAEPKAKEAVVEKGGEETKVTVPKRNRTDVSDNIKKVCWEILKSQGGTQKMPKANDPDPPVMPLNRLKKTMRADSQMKLKALKPEEFKKPVTPVAIKEGGVQRPQPKSKRSVEEELVPWDDSMPRPVPPPGFRRPKQPVNPAAPPPRDPWHDRYRDPRGDAYLPPQPRDPFTNRDPLAKPNPYDGMDAKLEREWALTQRYKREREDRQLLDREIDRLRVRKRDDLSDADRVRRLARIREEQYERELEEMKEAMYKEKAMNALSKAQVTGSVSDEELKREFQRRFGTTAAKEATPVDNIIQEISSSLVKTDEDANMALKMTTALTQALLNYKTKAKSVDLVSADAEPKPPGMIESAPPPAAPVAPPAMPTYQPPPVPAPVPLPPMVIPPYRPPVSKPPKHQGYGPSEKDLKPPGL